MKSLPSGEFLSLKFDSDHAECSVVTLRFSCTVKYYLMTGKDIIAKFPPEGATRDWIRLILEEKL